MCVSQKKKKKTRRTRRHWDGEKKEATSSRDTKIISGDLYHKTCLL
jgi:hypothetical protein